MFCCRLYELSLSPRGVSKGVLLFLQKQLARLKLLLIREQNGPGGEVIITRPHHNYLSCVRQLKVRHITYNLRYVTDVLNYKLT